MDIDKSNLDLLLTEILGVAPQTLLDDYVNVGNENVRNITESIEETLEYFISNPSSGLSQSERDAYKNELETGIIEFQTLLDSHTDWSFDKFETWCWRNTFMISPEVMKCMAVPHQKGLDLTISEREEKETREELAFLRGKLEAVSALIGFTGGFS